MSSIVSTASTRKVKLASALDHASRARTRRQSSSAEGKEAQLSFVRLGG